MFVFLLLESTASSPTFITERPVYYYYYYDDDDDDGGDGDDDDDDDDDDCQPHLPLCTTARARISRISRKGVKGGGGVGRILVM